TIADRPAADRIERLEPHGVKKRPHPLALERGHKHLPLACMRSAVKHQDRRFADARPQNRVRLARVQDVRISAEDLANRFWIREHHEPAAAWEREREGVTIKAMGFVQKAKRIMRKLPELPPRRRAGPRRQGRDGVW